MGAAGRAHHGSAGLLSRTWEVGVPGSGPARSAVSHRPLPLGPHGISCAIRTAVVSDRGGTLSCPPSSGPSSVLLEGLEAAQGYAVSVLFRSKEGPASRSSEVTIIPQRRRTGALRWKEGKGLLNVWTWKWWGPVCDMTQMGGGCATHFPRQGGGGR